ncbi:MAG: DJ-1/PfpI family protein [bacterium]
MTKKNAKSVLMVLAHHNFRDEEYKAAREKFESIGAQIIVASTVKSGASGNQGTRLDPDLLIDEVDPNQYDAVVFIGGTGASQYWHDVKAHEIAKVAARNGRVVGASSHAPVTLAFAGLLKGKKVTGHASIFEKLAVHGAKYTGKKLEQEGNIITCSGPNAAKEFAEALANSLNQVK